MRGQWALAVVAAALVAALGPGPAALGPDSAEARPRAMIAFAPTPPEPGLPLMHDLARRGMAVGVTSPTLGGYRREQTLLDMSQGSRVARRAYDDWPPRLALDPVELRVDGFAAAVRRAREAPGEIEPGLLGDALARRGLAPAYVAATGPRPDPNPEAVVAADRRGELAAASLGPPETLVARTLEAWRSHRVVVARLPAGRRAALAALDRLLRARGPEDLVYVVRAPPVDDEIRLLPTGLAGPGFAGGVLRSDSTRRDGLVTATDAPVTVLRHLGVPVPGEMEGEPIERRAGSAGEVEDLVDRLNVVVGRRLTTVLALVGTAILLFGGLALARGRDGLRGAARIALLTGLWLPGTALLTAALAPSRAVEVAILALGSLALGALTDRLVRWPLAPAVPAAAVFGAHAVDMALGSPLIGQSLAGSSPKGGARFYGIGNELEALLAMEVLLGLGAALTLARRRWAPRGFALGCLVAAAIMGSGRLGADVGAVITVGAGGAGAVLAALPGRPSRRAIAVAVLVPVLAVAALVGLDAATGGDAHLSRTVLQADEGEDVAEVVERRYQLLVDDLRPPVSAALVVAGVALLWLGIRRRDRLLGPLREHPAFAAGMWGALAATIVGAISNDSGPIVFQIGWIFVALGTGYVWGGARGAARMQ